MDSVETREEEPQIGPAPPQQKETKEEFSGKELPYELINGIPCYQQGHVVDNTVEIFERIGYDDTVGATYLGLAPDGKELVVRVGPGDEELGITQAEATVRMEGAFMCKVEADNEWRFFSQVHKFFDTDDATHRTYYYRGGPTLEQCLAFRNNKFSLGTAGRLSADVLEIIKIAHKHGYVLRSVNFDCFHFDASCRHLFMADISSFLPYAQQVDGESIRIAYKGNSDFAPISHHNGESHNRRGDIESWFYQFLYMLSGGLPWDSIPIDSVGEMKKEMVESGKIYDNLPEQISKIGEIVFKEGDIEKEDYENLKTLIEEVYRVCGGVVDHDENMDFEREPTEDELPRLVLCRDDEVKDTNGEENDEPTETENEEKEN